MSVWDTYPVEYRSKEVHTILKAVRAGESVSLVGLSGAGKSNLLGFLANRWPLPGEADDLSFILVDCNRLDRMHGEALFHAIQAALGDSSGEESNLQTLDVLIAEQFASDPRTLCVMLDRFDALQQAADPMLYNHLRALRDANKYRLSFLIATRRPLSPDNELAELFYAHTIWLGPLSRSDAEWNVARYAQRREAAWDGDISRALVDVSWGYASMLRAVCEAYADLETLEAQDLIAHPAVQRRIREFWADKPDDSMLEKSGLLGHPMLMAARAPEFDTSELTAKEHVLLNYFLTHPGEVCEKDALILAVWPEDAVFEEGVRDDSLAQLVRRLRKKIEPDPTNPRFIHTVPGRGYKFTA